MSFIYIEVSVRHRSLIKQQNLMHEIPLFSLKLLFDVFQNCYSQVNALDKYITL